MKFIVVRTEVTPERPHGLSYSLTLHAPDGERLVGFDNAVSERFATRCGSGEARERAGAARATIGIGCGRSDRTITGMHHPRRWSRISGTKWTRF